MCLMCSLYPNGNSQHILLRRIWVQICSSLGSINHRLAMFGYDTVDRAQRRSLPRHRNETAVVQSHALWDCRNIPQIGVALVRRYDEYYPILNFQHHLSLLTRNHVLRGIPHWRAHVQKPLTNAESQRNRTLPIATGFFLLLLIRFFSDWVKYALFFWIGIWVVLDSTFAHTESRREFKKIDCN